MHEQNGTLVRDGTERMMLMEVCPVCGEQRRDNARFCTTCGHRFMVEELLAEPLSPASTAVRHELSSADIPVVPGWPAPATSADTSPWAPSSSDRGGWPAPPEEAAPSDLLEVTWAEIAANALRSSRRAQPAVAVADLESEPARKLIEVFAYREVLLRARINDAARQRMLAFATGANLDAIAAYYGVSRFEGETDTSLRRRTQLAPEAMPHGGTVGSYRFLALQAAFPALKDVGVVARGRGHVDVVLLGNTGRGVVASDVIEKVRAKLLADDGAPATDVIAVVGASIDEAKDVLVRRGQSAAKSLGQTILALYEAKKAVEAVERSVGPSTMIAVQQAGALQPLCLKPEFIEGELENVRLFYQAKAGSFARVPSPPPEAYMEADF